MSSMAANRGRFHAASVTALAGLLALGIYACAGSGTTGPDASSSPSVQEQVQDVQVESEAGLSRVTLVGLENPIFTAFQQSDPDRLIVDLSGVEWQASSDTIQVDVESPKSGPQQVDMGVTQAGNDGTTFEVDIVGASTKQWS